LKFYRAALFLTFAFYLSSARAESAAHLSQEDALAIGKKIWKNECDGTVDGLTSWNDGESFASLGIGHFIWYPKGQNGPFEESFPPLLEFLKSHKAAIPEWLSAPGLDCPWNTKDEFLRDFQSPRLRELRNLLSSTIGLQARFAANRLEAAMPKILSSIPENQKLLLQARFNRVSSHPLGLYALMDYVNFKGEGIKSTERYQGEGWGLLQVLEGMKETPSGAPAVHAFADSATAALTRRVKNSPPARGEARWLPGWTSRINTYRP